jgi:hypothetical protein
MTIELAEDGGKTKLVLKEKLAGKNFFVRTLLPLMKTRISRLLNNNFESLKKFAESSQ